MAGRAVCAVPHGSFTKLGALLAARPAGSTGEGAGGGVRVAGCGWWAGPEEALGEDEIAVDGGDEQVLRGGKLVGKGRDAWWPIR